MWFLFLFLRQLVYDRYDNDLRMKVLTAEYGSENESFTIIYDLIV